MTAPELLSNGPRDAAWTVVLAHGAAEGMDSPFMTAFAEGLPARAGCLGGVRTVRFEFPYMALRRHTGRPRPPDREPVLLDCWRSVIASLTAAGCPRERLVISGKSLGGRMAGLVADEQAVAGLVCLGYPFHPPGQPERLRTAHLAVLRTPTLILQGERDPFGTREEVSGYRLSPAVRLHWLEDGDHGFRPRKGSHLTKAQNWEVAMEAIVGFLAGLS